MPTDLYKQVNFTDGEGIVTQDFLDMERNLEAKLSDQLLQTFAFDSGTFSEPNGTGITGFANCTRAGSAYPTAPGGTGTNSVRLTSGTLYQKIASSTGGDPTFLACTFVGNGDANWVIAAGNGVNPRVDLLQIKLEYVTGGSEFRDFEDATSRIVTSLPTDKTRRVQFTTSVKSGTPAASPTIPAPDAGFVAVAAVTVGATYTTGTPIVNGLDAAAGNTASLSDLRMPLSIRGFPLFASDLPVGFTTNFAAVGNVWQSTNATNQLLAFARVPFGSRLVGFGITGISAATPVVTFGNSNTGVLTTGYTVYNTALTGSALTLTPSGSNTLYDRLQCEFTHSTAGAIITQLSGGSESSSIAQPLWSTGARSCFIGSGSIGRANSHSYNLAVRINNISNGGEIHKLMFYMATGL